VSRLGIGGFNPKLKKAAARLEDLRTLEDEPIPPNTLAELRCDVERRRRLISDRIRQIEDARLERVERMPNDGPHAMVRLLARVIGVGIETAVMPGCRRCCRERCATDGLYHSASPPRRKSSTARRVSVSGR